MDESSKESSGKRQSQEPEAAKLTNETRGSEIPAGLPASATPANKTATSGEQSPEVRAPGTTGESTFPVVWSPKLDGDEVSTDEILHSAAEEGMHASGEAPKDDAAASANASTASMSRSLRLAVMAASLAAAAAIGSFIGSLSATGVDRLWTATGMNVASARRAPAPATKTDLAEISALKANLDAATRGANGQLAKLAERLDRLERGQAEPAAKLTRIAELLERLEKKTAMAASLAASPETTGTIPSAAPAASEPKSSEKVLRDWVVREARGGRALVENRSGGLFDVTTGSLLPGLGHVESVKRQDGQWVVNTAHGVIYSAP